VLPLGANPLSEIVLVDSALVRLGGFQKLLTTWIFRVGCRPSLKVKGLSEDSSSRCQQDHRPVLRIGDYFSDGTSGWK